MAFVKSNPDNTRFNLSDILTHKDKYNVLSVYGPNETTVFVKSFDTSLAVSYICDANGNKWVLSNRNLKPVNRNDTIQSLTTKCNHSDFIKALKSIKTQADTKPVTQQNIMNTPAKLFLDEIITLAKIDYYSSALKADEQFSIDSNKKYAKFDYEKGLLLNSKLIKDETFKEYNEPVEPFSIDLSDMLITYVPVVSPVWYKDFARAGFCNTDDVNSFVNFDANNNPWFIIQTPKVVKHIEKEPTFVKQRIFNTVDELADNTVLSKFALILDTNEVYQTLYLREYNQYTQSQFAKGFPVVESIRDKADQIWVKISL